MVACFPAGVFVAAVAAFVVVYFVDPVVPVSVAEEHD